MEQQTYTCRSISTARKRIASNTGYKNKKNSCMVRYLISTT